MLKIWLTYFNLFLLAVIVVAVMSCSSSVHRAMEKEMSVSDTERMQDSTSQVKSSYEFEKETLTAKSLKAFELRSIQKIYDVADFIQIITDPTIDKSFRLQARQMMLDNFADSTNTILFGATEEKLDKFTVNELLDRMLNGYFPKLKVAINDVRTSPGLQQKDKDSYQGQLIYRQTIYRIDPNTKVKLNENLIRVSILLSKTTKTFGNVSKEVWTVFLGNAVVDEN